MKSVEKDDKSKYGTVPVDAQEKWVAMHHPSSPISSPSYNLPGPAWSCAWDSDDSCLLYAGLHNGTVMSFDMRNTAEHLHSLQLERPCPVTSLAFAPRNRSIGFL